MITKTMKYPKLKCEERKNTVVCSRDIKKMKKLRKSGLSYKQIGESLKHKKRVEQLWLWYF